MERTNWLCEHCLVKDIIRLAKIVDHIIPLTFGGPDTDENTRNLCKPCADAATAKQFGFRQKQEIGLDGWPVQGTGGWSEQ